MSCLAADFSHMKNRSFKLVPVKDKKLSIFHYIPFRPLCLLLLWSIAKPVYAVSVSLKVIDQYGEPIQHAVVSAPAQIDVVRPLSVAVMDQVDKQFLPHVLVIEKNQYVSFPNSDNIRHHVYSFSAAKSFEIRLFNSSNNASLQFDKPGIVALGCNIHDQMIGYIYVAENEITAMTDKNGMAELETSSDTLQVWHARLSANHSQRKQILLSGAVAKDVNMLTLALLPDLKDSVKRRFGSGKFALKGK